MNNSNLLFGMSENYSKNSLSQDECHNLAQKYLEKSDIEKEKVLIKEELKNSGKPNEIIEKISMGKINKFKEENSLISQAWVMEPKKKVKDIMFELKISDLKIKEFYRLKIGE